MIPQARSGLRYSVVRARTFRNWSSVTSGDQRPVGCAGAGARLAVYDQR